MLRHIWSGAKKVFNKAVDVTKSMALAVVTTVTGVVAGAVATAKSAMAALPTGVATTVTAIQTDGQSIFDLVFPVIAAFVGLTIVVKLFKRWSNKV